jgi:hypothetical protein
LKILLHLCSVVSAVHVNVFDAVVGEEFECVVEESTVDERKEASGLFEGERSKAGDEVVC